MYRGHCAHGVVDENNLGHDDADDQDHLQLSGSLRASCQRKRGRRTDLNSKCDAAVICPALDRRVGRSTVHAHVDDMKDADENTEDEKQPSLVLVLVGLL
jgi:hypothetical protein